MWGKAIVVVLLAVLANFYLGGRTERPSDAATTQKILWTCLHYAAWDNYPALADVLLAHGAPVDEPTAPDARGGASPLFLACEKGHTEVARKLLAAGADPHLARTDGTTPFTMTFEGACDIKALLKNTFTA